MPNRAEIWEHLTDLFASELQERFDTVTIGGQTMEAKYGISKQTCQRFRVGFAPAELNLAEYLFKQFGLTGTDLIAAQGYGLISIPAAPPYRAYNVFNGRLVFPYPSSDSKFQVSSFKFSPCYFSGRSTDLTPASDYFHDAKYVHAKLDACGLKERPFYLALDFNSPTLLVEGHMHALKLRQEGFSAVAIGGGRPTEQMIRELRRVPTLFYIPDVDVLAPNEQTVIESGGVKKFIPAKSAEQKLSDLIPLLRDIPRCRLVRYPADFRESFAHGDMNDFWQWSASRNGGPFHAFSDLLQQAADLDQLEIEAIPSDLSAADRATRIAELLPRLAPRSPIETGDFLARLKAHLRLPNDVLSHLKKQIKKMREAGVEPEEDASDFSHAAQFRQIYPGQDFADGVLYYTIFKKSLIEKHIEGQRIESVVTKPYIISSSGEFFPAAETELTKRKLYFAPDCAPQTPVLRWSDLPGLAYSIPEYLADRAANTPSTGDLYEAVRSYFKNHLYLETESYYDFITHFTFVSYCIQVFDTFGFLALNGTRGTGKSKTLDLIGEICWDPVKGSSQSESFIFRTVDTRSPVMMLDEAEALSSMLKVNNQVSDKSLLLNDAYRKGGGVGRCVGTENRPYVFRVYTCYIIANIRGLEATLQSRTFFMPMLRIPSNIKKQQFNRVRMEEQTALLRRQLHCWTLSHAAEIAGNYERLDGEYDSFLDEIGLRDREREIWTPILTLALTIDELCNRKFVWNAIAGVCELPKPGSVLYAILDAQTVLRKIKAELMQSQDTWPTFLTGLRQIMRQKDEPNPPVTAHSIAAQPEAFRDNWFSTEQVRTYLNRLHGLQYFPKKSGPNSVRFLMAKVYGTQTAGSPAYFCRHRSSEDKSNRSYIRLDLEKIETACRTHEIAPDAEIELAEPNPPATSQSEAPHQQEGIF